MILTPPLSSPILAQISSSDTGVTCTDNEHSNKNLNLPSFTIAKRTITHICWTRVASLYTIRKWSICAYFGWLLPPFNWTQSLHLYLVFQRTISKNLNVFSCWVVCMATGIYGSQKWIWLRTLIWYNIVLYCGSDSFFKKLHLTFKVCFNWSIKPKWRWTCLGKHFGRYCFKWWCLISKDLAQYNLNGPCSCIKRNTWSTAW